MNNYRSYLRDSDHRGGNGRKEPVPASKELNQIPLKKKRNLIRENMIKVIFNQNNKKNVESEPTYGSSERRL
mgnify:CR=1 FL=1